MTLENVLTNDKIIDVFLIKIFVNCRLYSIMCLSILIRVFGMCRPISCNCYIGLASFVVAGRRASYPAATLFR